MYLTYNGIPIIRVVYLYLHIFTKNIHKRQSMTLNTFKQLLLKKTKPTKDFSNKLKLSTQNWTQRTKNKKKTLILI